MPRWLLPMIGGRQSFQRVGLLPPATGAAILLLLWLLPVTQLQHLIALLSQWRSHSLLPTAMALSSQPALYCAPKTETCCRSILWISQKLSLAALLAAI